LIARGFDRNCQFDPFTATTALMLNMCGVSKCDTNEKAASGSATNQTKTRKPRNNESDDTHYDSHIIYSASGHSCGVCSVCTSDAVGVQW
jgi:hypothetical protein